MLPLTCDETNDVCDVSDVTLIIADTFGSGTINILLDNNLDFVSEVHLDVCDIDQRAWLHINTSSCSTTARSSDFSCAISDLGGGCVGVDLTTAVSGLIDPDTGTIAQLSYTLDVTAPIGESADLNPENINLRDELTDPLTVTAVPGSVIVPAPPHFIPVADTSTWMDVWGAFKIEGVDTEVGDEVGIFVGNDCFGGYKVDTPGWYGFLPVYGDDPATPEKDGADFGDILTIKIWDNSGEVEYTLTSADYTGPDPLTWAEGDVVQVDIDATDILARGDNSLQPFNEYICQVESPDNSANRNVTGLSSPPPASTEHRLHEVVSLEGSFVDSPCDVNWDNKGHSGVRDSSRAHSGFCSFVQVW